VLNLIKGWLGERGAQFGMWIGLDSATYRRVHDVIIPAPGGTTQIDHVLVSVYGIFVVEVKNMGGWIFGAERAPKWTQSFFGQNFSFQNPLHQNYRHTKALSDFLGLPHEFFHSVIFFIGECEFRMAMPPNVMNRGLCSYVKSFGTRILDAYEVNEAVTVLAGQKAKPFVSHARHVSGLKERHEGTRCPKCGESLVIRTAKRGTNAGMQFYGCIAYPKCRYTREV